MDIDKKELLLASLHKQFLLDKGETRHIVSALCGLQAQFANNPGHALRARARDFAPDRWGEDLVKAWTFRHTLHAVRRDELGLFLSALGVPRAWNDDWGVKAALKPRWAKTIAGWVRRGVAGREELKGKCREKGMAPELLERVFHGWGGLISEMAHRGMIAYAPGTAKRFVACDGVRFTDRDKARATLLERYFRHLGPATMDDCAVFTGFGKKTVADILAKYPLPLESVACEGAKYWYIGEWDASRNIPPCLFLSGFDQLLMAYRDRSRAMRERDKPLILTNTGIIHPTVLVNGVIKARWKKDGAILKILPFAGLGRRERRRVAAHGEEMFGDAVTAVEFVPAL